MKLRLPGVLVVAVAAFFAGRMSDGVQFPDSLRDLIPNVLPAVLQPAEKAGRVTYVYEKDEHAIPSPVLAALNKLNRERGTLATMIEADVKDGTGEVPDQYKAALAAAKQAGLPALVVTAGDKVLAVVKNPKSEQTVLEAVR